MKARIFSFVVIVAAGLATTAAKAEDRGFMAYYNDPAGVEMQAPYEDQQAAVDAQQLAREYPSSTREIVADPTNERPGTITIDTRNRYLYLSLSGGRAMRYGVGVGREGFAWHGRTQIGRKAEWPDWVPPKEMLKRSPDLPARMAGGEDNPLGARALYLYSGKRDTMFRIHGSNEPWTIGHAVSSGCIRMLNEDVTDLFNRVRVGTAVVVL
jgi:lipoprotein-anchoring transpeptidase ErfK/SrfK